MIRHIIAVLIGLALAAGTAIAQKRKLPESATCELSTTPQKPAWEQTETYCLKVLEGLVVRKGGALRLILENGATKAFSDVTDGCDEYVFEKCAFFRLHEYSRVANSFSVRVSYLECGNFIVVDRRSGKEILLYEMPIFSPKGTWFVSVNASEACDRPDDIGIWSSAVSPPKPEWQYAHPHGRYESWEFIGWDGETTIKLRATVFDGNGLPKTFDTEAVYTTDGWELDRPWAAAR